MPMYDDMALLTDSLLAEFGQPVTIRHTVPGEYDPEIGGASSVTTDSVGVGAVFDFGLFQSGLSFAAGSMILAGDKQLLLSPVGIVAPAPGDIALIGSETWSIVTVKTTAPAGIAVIYECQLRK